MIDPMTLAETTISYFSEHLVDMGKAVAGQVKKAAGKKIADWLLSKLDKPEEVAAIEKLQAEPESPGNIRMVEGALMARLEQEPELMEQLAKLLKDAGAGDQSITQTSHQEGDNNRSAQVVGSKNKIDLGDRR